jgi:ATP-dependent DNA helicase DinG
LPVLQSWLVEPAEVFCREVLQRCEGAATVLTSATLAVGRSFAYPKHRLGFDRFEGPVRELRGREIFDYERNSLVYVEKELVPPVYENADLFLEQSVKRVAELIEASGGRALILLSTWKALKRFREEIFDLVDPYPVKFQGDESPSRLISWLKTTPGAVLVGTRTFWEGVDVPGDALSLVVIDKVPFPPPGDPVVKKLFEKAGSRWFTEVSLPRAQMSLQQGSGRLIRTHTDRGVIAILDSRIHRKPWGRAVLSCLPDETSVTTALGDVRAFFSVSNRVA